MITQVWRRLAAVKRTRAFWKLYDSMAGSDLERTCAAVAVLERGGGAPVRTADNALERGERPIFRAAFECYVGYLFRRGLRHVASADDISRVVDVLHAELAARSAMPRAIFSMMWDAVQSLPNDLRPGRGTGVLLPWAQVAAMLQAAGVRLSPTNVLDAQWGMFATVLYDALPEQVARSTCPRGSAVAPLN